MNNTRVAYNNRARAYEKWGKAKRALRDYRRAYRLNPWLKYVRDGLRRLERIR